MTFSCSYCCGQYKTSTKHKLKKHIEQSHLNNTKFSCIECHSWSYTNDELFPKEEHSISDGPLCKKCVSFHKNDMSSTLSLGIDKQHNGVVGCKICSEKFGSKDGLMKHLDEAHLLFNKPFTDDNYSYFNRSDQQAQSCEEGINPKKNFGSDFGFSCHSKLNETRLGLTSKLKDLCDYCGYKDNSKRNFKVHSKNTQLSEGKTLLCNSCSKKFFNYKNMVRHIEAVHLKLKPFECGECDYKCSQKGDLKRHTQVVHLKLKFHSCEFCDYKSAYKIDITRHGVAKHRDKVEVVLT